MLTETFVVSLGNASDNARADPTKDASIILIEHQPVVQQRISYKKSSTSPNCLAISSSHIFAAQADKAVVNVYSRSKGSHEATVPFSEKITCITLACDDTVLVLGTIEGRLILWEVATGRQITTAQSHLQSITCLAVDGKSSHLISTSLDTTARVWSLPQLLSFSTDIQSATPIQTFDGHRSAIRTVALGHSNSSTNLACTIAEDRACMIWSYCTSTTTHTFLLSAIPTCVSFDSADRAVYVGYDDGSAQQLDLLKTKSQLAIQPGDKRRWTVPENTYGAALSLAVSFDSTQILTGHQSGAILAWDVANGHMRQLPLHPPISRPVTNLQFLPTVGFADSQQRSFRIESIVKPKFGAFQNTDASVPGNYTATVQLLNSRSTSFKEALTAPVVPQALLNQGLDELKSWSQPHTNGEEIKDDFMAFDHTPQHDLQQQNKELKQQLEALRRVQHASFDRIENLSAERRVLLQREQQRMMNDNSMEDD